MRLLALGLPPPSAELVRLRPRGLSKAHGTTSHRQAQQPPVCTCGIRNQYSCHCAHSSCCLAAGGCRRMGILGASATVGRPWRWEKGGCMMCQTILIDPNVCHVEHGPLLSPARKRQAKTKGGRGDGTAWYEREERPSVIQANSPAAKHLRNPASAKPTAVLPPFNTRSRQRPILSPIRVIPTTIS